MLLRLIPSVVAFFLLAAHFLRGGNLALAVACVLVPTLFLVRRRWSLIMAQICAYVAAGVWLTVMIDLVRARMIMHRPWGTAAIILASVTLFTILAGWLLNSPVLHARYLTRANRRNISG